LEASAVLPVDAAGMKLWLVLVAAA